MKRCPWCILIYSQRWILKEHYSELKTTSEGIWNWFTFFSNSASLNIHPIPLEPAINYFIHLPSDSLLWNTENCIPTFITQSKKNTTQTWIFVDMRERFADINIFPFILRNSFILQAYVIQLSCFLSELMAISRWKIRSRTIPEVKQSRSWSVFKWVIVCDVSLNFPVV